MLTHIADVSPDGFDVLGNLRLKSIRHDRSTFFITLSPNSILCSLALWYEILMVKSLVQRRSISGALKIGRTAAVPNLIFMTDDERVRDPVGVCHRLPAGAIIICRDYNHPDRVGLSKRLRRVTRELHQFLLVAGDEGLARQVDADGYHMPEHQLKNPPNLAAFGLVSAACHSRSAILQAQKLAVDFALVSPVFRTNSHPDVRPLGIHRLARLAAVSKVPLVALGGITEQNAAQLKTVDLIGIAAIGAFARL
jgi:thiamine-phosphate pyrophosphorylase